MFQYNDTGMLPTFGASTSSYDLASLNTTSGLQMGGGMPSTGLDDASMKMEGGGVIDPLDMSHVDFGNNGPYSNGSHGSRPTSPDRMASTAVLGRARSGSGGLSSTNASSDRHYLHPNYHHHAPHTNQNQHQMTTLSGGFINAAVAATASSIASSQLLYGKSRNKTPVGVQYASTSTVSSSSGLMSSSAMGSLFKQGKGN